MYLGVVLSSFHFIPLPRGPDSNRNFRVHIPPANLGSALTREVKYELRFHEAFVMSVHASISLPILLLNRLVHVFSKPLAHRKTHFLFFLRAMPTPGRLP